MCVHVHVLVYVHLHVHACTVYMCVYRDVHAYMCKNVVCTIKILCFYVGMIFRSVEHSYGFMILNRLNNENMLEEVVPNMEFRVQNPFVLFKKKSGELIITTRSDGVLPSGNVIRLISGYSCPTCVN